MKTSFVCATLALLVVGSTGCSSKEKHLTQKDITGDLTPELKGIAMRPSDAHNGFAITSNTNLRLMSDDLARTFYTSTPSRLTPFPIVNNAGQPW
jgi:hypothetical protein